MGFQFHSCCAETVGGSRVTKFQEGTAEGELHPGRLSQAATSQACVGQCMALLHSQTNPGSAGQSPGSSPHMGASRLLESLLTRWCCEPSEASLTGWHYMGTEHGTVPELSCLTPAPSDLPILINTSWLARARVCFGFCWCA